MVARLEDGEQVVHNVFHAEFPGERFEDWDREVIRSVTDHLINTVGRASRIDVVKFIDDLRDA